jgi:hypothetical protein
VYHSSAVTLMLCGLDGSSGQVRIATQDRAAAFHSPAALRRCLAFTAFGPTSTTALTLPPAAMSLTTPRRYP